MSRFTTYTSDTASREGKADINGTSIWYKLVGTGPVLAVQAPGWGIGSGMYQETLADLASRYTLLFHDPRTSGQSSGADPDYSRANVGQFADDLEALRRKLDIESFYLLGHSHGAYVAMNYALAYPQRVRALVLAGAQLGVDEPGADLQRTLPVLAADPRFQAAVAAFTGPRKLDDDTDFSHFLRRIGPLYFKNPTGPGLAGFLAFLDHHRVSLKTFFASASTDRQFEVRSRLPTLQVPTLCMVGDADFICSPVQATAIRDAVPGAVLARFADSGHFCWIEEPLAFRTVLNDFLARCGSTQ